MDPIEPDDLAQIVELCEEKANAGEKSRSFREQCLLVASSVESFPGFL